MKIGGLQLFAKGRITSAIDAVADNTLTFEDGRATLRLATLLRQQRTAGHKE
jgi:hypothetical protein